MTSEMEQAMVAHSKDDYDDVRDVKNYFYQLSIKHCKQLPQLKVLCI
jgi:hypothetical protein